MVAGRRLLAPFAPVLDVEIQINRCPRQPVDRVDRVSWNVAPALGDKLNSLHALQDVGDGRLQPVDLPVDLLRGGHHDARPPLLRRIRRRTARELSRARWSLGVAGT